MLLNRSVLTLLMVFVATGFSIEKIGFDFNAGSSNSVGCNIRITNSLEIKPGLAYQSDENGIGGSVAINYYFLNTIELQNYFGIGLFISEDDLDLNPHYGLRYDINEIISTFGEIGINVTINPNSLSTITSGIGLTIYFPK